MKLILCLILIFGFCSNYILAANILVLESCASPSHHIWIKTLTIELASRGHNITSISADIDSKVTPNLHYHHMENVYDDMYNTTEDLDFIEMGQLNSWIGLFAFSQFTPPVCKSMIQSKGFKSLNEYPNDFKFDLILHDFIMGPCLLGFVHKFNYPPLVGVTAFNSIASSMNVVGSLFYPHIPLAFTNKFEPTFFGRVENFLLFLTDRVLKSLWITPTIDSMVAKHYSTDTPPVHTLEKLTKLVLINNNPAVDDIEPMLPNVIPVGGLQIQKPKGLPEDLKKIADNAKNSLILFSLGTNMRSDMLGPKRLAIILETFRDLPQYTFLWKFESSESDLPVPVPKNVHIRAWLPQTEILAHPNTVLFITHSGHLSTLESSWYGIPMLGLPVFADQFTNIDRVMKKGIAERLFFSDLSKTTFRDSIENVVQNPKYRKASKMVANNFRDQKEAPLERAVWWIEWMLRNPNADFLQNPLMEYNLFAQHSIDIIAFITVVPLLILIICQKVTLFIIRCLLCRKNTSNSGKRKVKRN